MIVTVGTPGNGKLTHFLFCANLRLKSRKDRAKVNSPVSGRQREGAPIQFSMTRIPERTKRSSSCRGQIVHGARREGPRRLHGAQCSGCCGSRQRSCDLEAKPLAESPAAEETCPTQPRPTVPGTSMPALPSARPGNYITRMKRLPLYSGKAPPGRLKGITRLAKALTNGHCPPLEILKA